jgi:hypothetical protein
MTFRHPDTGPVFTAAPAYLDAEARLAEDKQPAAA